MHSTEIVVDEIDEHLVSCLLHEAVLVIEQVGSKYRITVEFDRD